MHSACDGYLSGPRDDLEKAFLADAFPRQGRSVRPSEDACGHLVDQVAAFLSETPKAFHRQGGELIAALIERHLSRSSTTVIMREMAPGANGFLNIPFLYFFAHPGAISPMGAISRIPVR